MLQDKTCSRFSCVDNSALSVSQWTRGWLQEEGHSLSLLLQLYSEIRQLRIYRALQWV